MTAKPISKRPVGGMESAGAIQIIRKSVETKGVMYTKYLGDGDSKGFASVVEDKPYGNVTAFSA